MRILSVVGARPQFVKLAPIAAAMETDPSIDHVILHTGQHYDVNMSNVFFEGLHIPEPDINLAVGSGSHGVQTGAMLAKLDGVFEDTKPNMVLVYGDTNSTLAGTLAAVKMQIPVAHLEAGLRSFNRAMPEEHNRILTDHAADLLLAPTQVAADHLGREGLAERTIIVGDVMADVCLYTRALVAGRTPMLPDGIDEKAPYLVATIHRAENTDDSDRLASIIQELKKIEAPVVLFAHPRLVEMARRIDLKLSGDNLIISKPVAYHELIAAMMCSAGVVTDSGGLQKEAYLLGKICTTVRGETEWVETLAGGWNVLTPDPESIVEHAMRQPPTVPQSSAYGGGHASEQAVREIMEFNG